MRIRLIEPAGKQKRYGTFCFALLLAWWRDAADTGCNSIRSHSCDVPEVHHEACVHCAMRPGLRLDAGRFAAHGNASLRWQDVPLRAANAIKPHFLDDQVMEPCGIYVFLRGGITMTDAHLRESQVYGGIGDRKS